jgi:hypothetical protein
VPYAEGLELSLIGALTFYGPDALNDTTAVTVDDFSPVNGLIWQAAHAIATRGNRPDFDLIAHELGPRQIDRCGGDQSLRVTLADAAGSTAVRGTITAKADALAERARARRVQAAALELATTAGTGGDLTTLIGRLNDLQQPATTRLSLTSAADVKVQRPDWIWTDRIPVGGVTLMPGREGDGKTALVCWLAARISRGQLAGQRHGHPCDVLYVGMEDDRNSVTVPRLIAAGADLQRFQFIDVDHHEGSFALDTHLDDLQTLTARRDVGLIVFDPLDAHLGGVDSYKKAEVQAAVGRLAVLTQQLRCAALGIAHLNKSTTTNDLLQRINGSRGFSTSVRSVLGLGAHPANPDERLCLVAKANLTDKSQVPAIRFRIESAQVQADDGEPFPTATVVILGEETGHDASDLLATLTGEERTQAREAAEWLADMLADGPITKAEIVRFAELEGFSDKSLRTAREQLGIVTERDETAKGRPSSWRLPP